MSKLGIVLSAWVSLAAQVAPASELDARLEAIGDQIEARVIAAPVVDAIVAQNRITAGYTRDRVEMLDRTWREQTVTGGAMVEQVLGNELSQYLASVKADSHGLVTEIFVTDRLGLNVGQSDITSDFWQGDEAKFQIPFASRKRHVGEIEFDESSQAYQSQISYPVLNDDGDVIGVVVVGINVDDIG